MKPSTDLCEGSVNPSRSEDDSASAHRTGTSMFKRYLVAIAGAVAMMASGAAVAADISGAGATFPAPVYAKWAEAYQAQTKNRLNYQAIGSGGGIRQITADTVDF